MPSAGFAQPVMERSPLLPGAHRRSSRRTSRTHLLLVLGVALAFAAAVYAQWMPLMQLVRWLNPSVMWFVDLPPGVRAAALTIDDSPRGDGSSTEAILDMLREAGVRATFFVISGQVRTERHRALLRRMVAEGHELANHGRAEERAILLTDDEYAWSLRVCDAFLRQYQPALRWHRPGSGFVNARMLTRSAALGYTTVLGSVFPHDPIVKRAWHTAFFLEWRTRPGVHGRGAARGIAGDRKARHLARHALADARQRGERHAARQVHSRLVVIIGPRATVRRATVGVPKAKGL